MLATKQYKISYDFCTVLDSGQKHIGIRRGCTYEEKEDSGCVNINDKGTIGPKSFSIPIFSMTNL